MEAIADQVQHLVVAHERTTDAIEDTHIHFSEGLTRFTAEMNERLSTLQLTPALDNFQGCVSAQLYDDAGKELLEGLASNELSLSAEVSPLQPCRLLVTLDAGEECDASPFAKRIDITEGNAVDLVTFVIAVDSEEIEFQPSSVLKTLRPENDICKAGFTFNAPTKPLNYEIYIEISQKNRLIQTLSLPLLVRNGGL
jgi:hypothetical protein